MNDTSEIKTEQEENRIDTDQILAENEALRNELARRDAEESNRRQLQQAKDEIAAEYEDFALLLDEIEDLLGNTSVLLDLAPKERYRIGYLMLKGQHSLMQRSKEPTVEELTVALKKHPEILRVFLKGKDVPGFSFERSAGIRTFTEKAPQNLTEARSAAIRYAKMR